MIATTNVQEPQAAEQQELTVLLDDINFSDATQSREKGLNEETVKQYVQDLENDRVFPKVVLYWDAEHGCYWIGAGFHRLEAYKRCGLDRVDAIVRFGNARDAWLEGVRSNQKHGLPFTNDDRREILTKLLEDPEYCAWSNRQLAVLCGFSDRHVARIRQEREDWNAPCQVLGADGRYYNTDKHGNYGPNDVVGGGVAQCASRQDEEDDEEIERMLAEDDEDDEQPSHSLADAVRPGEPVIPEGDVRLDDVYQPHASRVFALYEGLNEQYPTGGDLLADERWSRLSADDLDNYISVDENALAEHKEWSEKLKALKSNGAVKPTGKTMVRIHEAIGVLKTIPRNDPLRKEGFKIVTDWCKHNL